MLNTKTISFPKAGHNELIKIEDNSFWFNHRNKIIETIIKKYPIDGDFADIGWKWIPAHESGGIK